MFSELPVELLQYIFLLLSPCNDLITVLHVCKRWRDVAQSVLKIRESLSLLAFRMRSPLQWMSPHLNACTAKSKCTAPSKRFGATIILKEQSLYVFGGATKELTAFNDLWTFDLCSLNWKRVVGKGKLPTPRAHAKGGFIEDVLYLYGGCQSFYRPGSEHTGRVDWLTELNSFDLSTVCWSRLPLFEVNRLNPMPPPVFAGQSGCFLPKGGAGEPSVLVLFGGVSQCIGACVNHLFVISPESGCWISLSDAVTNNQGEWPSGRCGHSTCALDSNRMLLLFGNLESPLAADYPGYRQQEMSINRDLNNDSNVPGYRGQPAGDIWILTRCYPRTGQDWFEVDWFWTKVEYPQGIPGCPPIDFYHASAVSLPYREDNKSQVLAENGDLFQTNNYYSNHQKENVFTVVVISQPTTTLLDEAVRQRRYWQRVKISSELSSKTFQNKSVDQVYHISDYVDNDEGDRQHEPCCPADLNVHTSESDRILHVPSSRRSNNRRARRLEALSNQERRLFGTRNSSHCGNNTISNQSLASNQMLSVNNRCLYNPMIFNSPVRPLAVYSLNLTCFYSDISCDTKTRISFTECTAKGLWLVPIKHSYLDLYFAPPECLGFSCTFGHDCLFLFGGLTDSEDVRLDEGRNLISVEPDASQNRDNDDHCHRSINSPTLPLSSVTNESLTQGHLTPRVNTSDIIYRNSLGTAQFFVLRPRALAGTII